MTVERDLPHLTGLRVSAKKRDMRIRAFNDEPDLWRLDVLSFRECVNTPSRARTESSSLEYLPSQGHFVQVVEGLDGRDMGTLRVLDRARDLIINPSTRLEAFWAN